MLPLILTNCCLKQLRYNVILVSCVCSHRKMKPGSEENAYRMKNNACCSLVNMNYTEQNTVQTCLATISLTTGASTWLSTILQNHRLHSTSYPTRQTHRQTDIHTETHTDIHTDTSSDLQNIGRNILGTLNSFWLIFRILVLMVTFINKKQSKPIIYNRYNAAFLNSILCYSLTYLLTYWSLSYWAQYSYSSSVSVGRSETSVDSLDLDVKESATDYTQGDVCMHS